MIYNTQNKFDDTNVFWNLTCFPFSMSSVFLFKTSDSGKLSTVDRGLRDTSVGMTEEKAIANERKIIDEF